MLSLRLLPGEYMTIGDDIVVQYDRSSGEHCKLLVNAPREVPVVRGEVLERSGENRPDCVLPKRNASRQSIPWDQSKNELLDAIRKTLDDIEVRDSRATSVKRRLELLFPNVQDGREN